MNDLIEYAQRKLNEAYEAMYRDLHARTKQLERVTQELNDLKGASK